MVVKACASYYIMKCKGRSANPLPAERSIPNKVRDTSHDSGEVPHGSTRGVRSSQHGWLDMSGTRVKTKTQRSKKRGVELRMK